MNFITDILNNIQGKIDDFTNSISGAIRDSATMLGISSSTRDIVGSPLKGQIFIADQTLSRILVPVTPDVNNAIPVVYGEAFLTGHLVDSIMGSTGCIMYYVFAICEVTGDLMSTGEPSKISIEEVYWGDSRVEFKGDQVTVQSTYTASGTENGGVENLIKMYFYTDGSATPTKIGGAAGGTPAWNIVPHWTTNHTMNKLAFAVVTVEYESPTTVSGLDRITFKVKNTMSEPGDVLYDYMTSSRYGAGIPAGDIDV